MKVKVTLCHSALCFSDFVCNCCSMSLTWVLAQCLPCCHSNFTGVILLILALPIFPLIKQSVMGLKAPLKTFFSSHQRSSHPRLGLLHLHQNILRWRPITLKEPDEGLFSGDKKPTVLEGMALQPTNQPTPHTKTHKHMYADIQAQKKMSITFLWAIFYCWWAAIGFIASNQEWCSNFSFCFLLVPYSLYGFAFSITLSVSVFPSLSSLALHLCYSHFNIQ